MEDLGKFLFKLERDTLVEVSKKLGLDFQGNDPETFRIAKLRGLVERKVLLLGLVRLVKRLEPKQVAVIKGVLGLASLNTNEEIAEEILDFGFTEKVIPRLPEKTLVAMAKAKGLREKLAKEELPEFIEDQTVIRGMQTFLRSIPLHLVKYILEDLDLYTWGRNKEVRVNRIVDSVFDLELVENPEQPSDDEESPVQQPNTPKPPVEPVFKKPAPIEPKSNKRKLFTQMFQEIEANKKIKE